MDLVNIVNLTSFNVPSINHVYTYSTIDAIYDFFENVIS